MSNKKNILFTLMIGFTFFVSGQNSLPYSQSNFCFDDLIQVNAAQLSNTRNLVIADFNNDNLKDVVVTDVINNYIKIYSFLPASGTFSFQNLIIAPGTGFGTGIYRAVAAGDFDSDLKMDLVFTTDSFIYIFKNNGGFNFNQIGQIAIINEFVAQEHLLKVDNINNNGPDDFYFISANPSYSAGVAVVPFLTVSGNNFIPQGMQRVFTSYAATFTGINNFDVSIANIQNDGNGLKDLLLTYNQIADSVIFLENTSGITSLSFNKISVYLAPTSTTTILPDYFIKNSEIADVNGDNVLDFVFNGTGTAGDRIKVYAGSLSFSLSFHVDIPTICNFNDFKIAEINNDNNIDFVGIGTIFGFPGMVVYPGNGNNITYFNPSTSILFPFSTQADELQLEDIDNNGIKDILFKPWRGNSDHTFMIPNYSYKLNVSPLITSACSSQPAILTASSSATSGSYLWKDSTNNVIATAAVLTTTDAGIYYAHLDLTMYSNNTCTRYSDTVLVNSSAPVLSLSSSSLTVCYGTVVSTTVSGAASYSWSAASSSNLSSNTTFSLQAYSTANYTITGALTNGCTGKAVFNVNLFPLNTDVISTTKNPVCVGDVAVLSMPSASSYTWNITNYNSTFSISPTATTTYSLDFIDANGCSSSKNIVIDVDPNCAPKIYTGVTLNGLGTNNIFMIDNIENYKNNHVTIYNRWGQEIFSMSHYDNTTVFWPRKEDYGSLVPSTYFFVVNFGDGSETQKGWVELITN
ncbi:MAG: gliding motility-associated C-terminal domain-containing protein [Bacteroidia bacterium]